MPSCNKGDSSQGARNRQSPLTSDEMKMLSTSENEVANSFPTVTSEQTARLPPQPLQVAYQLCRTTDCVIPSAGFGVQRFFFV